MNAQERIADYLGIPVNTIDPVKAREVMDELADALADLDPGVRCGCRTLVEDGYCRITPCRRHKHLTGAARLDWLSRVLSFAARFEAVTR